MVQANPDASFRSRRPRWREERLAGDSGEERFLGSSRILGLELVVGALSVGSRGGACENVGRGLKDSEGRSLAEVCSRNLV